MDPIGTLAFVIQIAERVGALIASYNESTGKLKSLSAEVRIFEATVQHINVWLRSADLTDRESIMSGLSEALYQVKEVLLDLESELKRSFTVPEAIPGAQLKRWQKAKYAFNEDFFENCSKELNRWANLIQLALSASQLPIPRATDQSLLDVEVGTTVLKRMKTDARRRLQITQGERQSISPSLQRFFDSLNSPQGTSEDQRARGDDLAQGTLPQILVDENVGGQINSYGLGIDYPSQQQTLDPRGINHDVEQDFMVEGPPPAYTPMTTSPMFEEPRVQNRTYDVGGLAPNDIHLNGLNHDLINMNLRSVERSNGISMPSATLNLSSSNSMPITTTATSDVNDSSFAYHSGRQRSASSHHASSLSPLGSVAGGVKRKPVSSKTSPVVSPAETMYISPMSTGYMSPVPSIKPAHDSSQSKSANQLRKMSSNIYSDVHSVDQHANVYPALRSARSTPFLSNSLPFEKDGEPLILEAAQKGLTNVVAELLVRNADIEAISRTTKRNALCEAARTGHADVIDLLIRHDCALDRADAEGNGAIHWAAIGSHVGVMKLLLDKGVPIDVRGYDYQTPLHLISGTFNREAVQLLLRYLPEVDARDSSQQTPLHKSVIRGDTECCSLLLGRGASLTTQDDQGRTALQLATGAGQFEVVQLLLNHLKPKVNQPDVLDAFYLAVKSGNTAIVRCFLRHIIIKKLKNSESHKPLSCAIGSGDLSMIRLMIDNKCSTKQKDERGWGALHHAANSGNTAIVKTLIDKGLSCKALTLEKELPVHLALAAGHVPAAQLFLQSKDSPISAKDAHGQDCVHYTARNGSVEIMRLLIEKKAAINNENSYGWRPIHIAVAYGHLSLTQELLARGVNVEEKLGTTSYNSIKETHLAVKNGLWAEARWPYPGSRPLHLALEYGREEIAKFLINHVAKVDERDSESWRPLHHAAFYGSPTSVKLLLAAGAYPHALTQEGRTPLGLGFRTNEPQVSDEDRESVQDQLQSAMKATKKNKMDSWKKGMSFGGKTVQEKNQALSLVELTRNAL